MEEFIQQVSQAVASLDWEREPRGLYEPIAYTMASGGKRLRPTLCLIAADMFSPINQDVINAAMAIEVFHNFTLLHDDVMDRAATRRGKPSVHVRWNDNTAILSGDEMVIEAYTLLQEIRSDKLPSVLKAFNRMAREICEGQQYDMDFETRSDVTIRDYMEMIRLKTSVLLATALQLGALLGGASEADQAALYRYGINLGLAFQLQDDWLDVYGDPDTFGKAIGGDILCNKKTFMLLTAIQTAEGELKRELDYWFEEGTDRSQEKISAVTNIYNQLSVDKACQAEIRRYTEKALKELSQLNVDIKKKLTLTRLAEKLLVRKD